MNTKDFEKKLSTVLKTSQLNDVNDATAAKLKAARQKALNHYRHNSGSKLTWAGPLGEYFESFHSYKHLIWAPLIAALLAFGITSYLEFSQPEPDDIDALLLSGELPVHAYIDKDFDSWLKGYSH
jgi:hypothetical protein